jgi:hypothetical protein
MLLLLFGLYGRSLVRRLENERRAPEAAIAECKSASKAIVAGRQDPGGNNSGPVILVLRTGGARLARQAASAAEEHHSGLIAVASPSLVSLPYLAGFDADSGRL